MITDFEGNIIFSQNESEKKIPASTLKLVTSLAAFHYLDKSYRFPTEFYISPENDLVIKGYGDPLLISEELEKIATTLAQKIKTINDIIIDDSFFKNNISIPMSGNSSNPYDAPVGGLCVNFNTINFKRDKQGRIISAEQQTPMLDYARNKINILDEKSGRYTFTHDRDETLQYAGELFRFFFVKKGLKVLGQISKGKATAKDILLYRHESSFTLEEMVKKMMQYSSNFMANQMFISIGAKIYGPPGTLEKSVKAVMDYSKKELALKDIEIEEGSGISRKNHISANDMLIVLKHFKPYKHLLNKNDEFYFKTGTLSGIHTRAGYFETNKNKGYYLTVFTSGENRDINKIMHCIKRTLSGKSG